MTKTEACRRVALAALLAGAMAGAHEARADRGIATNGLDLNGVNMQGVSPHGAGPDAAAPARAADPSRLRLRAARPATPERAAGPEGGVRIALWKTDKPEPTPTPKK
jgi:hypothetical protein